MIDVFDLYNDFRNLVNTWQGGNWSLNEAFIRNLNIVYSFIANREIRNARKSQESKDNAIAFLVSKNIIIKSSPYERYAILPLPKDYFRFSSSRIVLIKNETIVSTIPDISVNKGKCFDGKKSNVTIIQPTVAKSTVSEIAIELIDDAQWAGCMNHLKKFPTMAAPKMVQINGTFQIAPKEVSVCVFSYYKSPAPAILSVTYTDGDNQFGEGDEVIYNESKSTKILLPLNLKNEILWMLGEAYGYFTREQFLAAFGNQKAKE